MGLGNSEIETLRARVPLAYRPWDRPSAPVKPPGNEVSQVDDAARRLTETLLSLARGDGDIAERTGHRAPAGKITDSRIAVEDKKRKEADTKFALDQARKALDEHIRWLEEQIEGIKKERAVIAERRTEIKDSLAALDELEALRASGKLDPNNPAHQRLLKRAGISPEEARRGDLATVIASRRGGLTLEDTTLESRDAALARKQADYETRLGNARDLAAQMDANPGDDALKARALSMAQTTEGTRELAWAAAISDSRDTKELAAAAVAKAEDADVQAESGAFTLAATTDISGLQTSDTSGFDLDAPPAGQSSAADAVGPTPIDALPLTPQFAAAADPGAVAPMAQLPAPAPQSQPSQVRLG